MNRPLFSIIIPVYNVAPYLRECLDSVLAQTYTDWEAICVDDGSTDGSGAILDEYAAKDPRFKVIHKANAGVSAARNCALEHVGGSWVTFVDSDDIMRPDWLSWLSKQILTDEKLDAIRFAYMTFEDSPDWGEDRAENHSLSHDLSERIDADFLRGCTTMTCLYAIRRSLCKDLRFPPYVCGEDRLFTFACLCRIRRVLVTDGVFYGYRMRSDSYTHKGIATCRGMRDELLYRLEFIRQVDLCKKKIDLASAEWLLPFFKEQYLAVLGRYASEEKRLLVRAWNDGLATMIKWKGISLEFRLRLMLNRMLPFYWSAWLFVYAISHLQNGGSPLRLIKRKLRFGGQ